MRKTKIHVILPQPGVGEIMREEFMVKQREEKPLVGYLLKDMEAEPLRRKNVKGH